MIRIGVSVAFCLMVIQAWGAKPTICIDPGHTSEIGSGCAGKYTTELKVAWEVALRLRKLLERDGFSVVMTKKTIDQKVTNKARAEIANRARAALMVRLHCDAVPNERGLATFYPARAGKDGKVIGPSPEVLQAVKPMAQRFHAAVIKSLNGGLRDRGLRTDRQTKIGAQYGALKGSIHSNVPSILVEMCVLTNPKDENFIRMPAGLDAMAKALHAGIKAASAKPPSANLSKSAGP